MIFYEFICRELRKESHKYYFCFRNSIRLEEAIVDMTRHEINVHSKEEVYLSCGSPQKKYKKE